MSRCEVDCGMRVSTSRPKLVESVAKARSGSVHGTYASVSYIYMYMCVCIWHTYT